MEAAGGPRRSPDSCERLIAVAAPFLDVVLAVGERVSRVVGPEDDYYPIRPSGERLTLPGASGGVEASRGASPAE